MEILRKITIKTCGNFTIARIKSLLFGVTNDKGEQVGGVKEGESVALLRIAGNSTAAKTGQTDKGEYTKLLGEFIGTDLTTGELYQSGQCILPEFVGGTLGAALKSGSAVRFAFEIHARRKDSAVTGYEFVVKPLMQAEASDSLKELAALAGIDVTKAPPALPPAAAPAPAVASAPAAAPAADPAPAAAAKGKGK